jgi:2-keto-4-pentenoate hydratase
MKLHKNGQLVNEGTGAAVLGDPCLSVAWLANRLWDYGVTLKAGEIILSGAFSAAPAAQKGDSFVAEFSSFGKVEAVFV